MKAKYLIITLLLACTQFSFAQDKLFDKYAETEDVTSVYISKAMFQMMPAIGNIGLSLTNMKGKVESLQLVTTERQDLIPQMRSEFSKLVGSQHQELMRVRDGKTRATFYSNMKGDQIKDLIMLTDSDSMFVAMQLTGDFTLQDIQDIASEMNKQGEE
jgi:hypothetical protein